MATDVEMTGVTQITGDREFPPPSVVEQWTPEQLFGFAPIPKILLDEKNRARFQNAEISGSSFLRDGDVRDFWLHQFGLPFGLGCDLAELAQTIKNMGMEKSRGNAFHLATDEPAHTFTVQSLPTPWEGVLPTPSVVEQWTQKDVLAYTPIKDILEYPEDKATFTRARKDGKAFLLAGDDRRFWTGDCHLPPGTSVRLADLTQRIKNMGKEKSRGNVFHLGAEAPANSFTVESPPSIVIVEKFKFLHGLLWGQEGRLGRTVFCKFQHPSWNRETNPHINTDDTRTAVKLSITDITSGAQSLPCGASELLVRGVYQEMYDILLRAQKHRMAYDEEEIIPYREKIILILGQPGIGKAWFLSYVLVRRLEGKPTIFQVAENFGGDRGYTTATHYLIDGNGVREMALRPPLLELKNSDIWVLADKTPFGTPRQVAEHDWLVVVTSSPRKPIIST